MTRAAAIAAAFAFVAGCRPAPTSDPAGEREAAFVEALLKNDETSIQRLLGQGVPINKPLTVQSAQGGLRHPTAVMIAAMEGRVELVRKLAGLGADLKAKDEKGRSALLWAQFGKDHSKLPELAKLFADAGVDLDAPANDGVTPLMFAVGSGDAPLVEFLLAHGADPNHQAADGSSPLFLAIRAADAGIIRTLVDHKADVNLRVADGSTPLLALTSVETLGPRDKDIALFLLQRGAYPNVTDKLGMSPLLYAVEKNQSELAKALLDFHANPNFAEKGQGMTPLMACVINKNYALAKTLVAYHADANAQTRKDGVTAFTMARDQRDDQMLAILKGK